MGRWKRVFALSAAALLLQGIAVWGQGEAVEIQLSNGDRLRGELLSEGEVVVIKHAVLGELEIAKSQIRTIVRPEEAAVDVNAADAEAAKPKSDPKKPKAASAPAARKSKEAPKSGGTLALEATDEGKLDRAIRATRINRIVDLVDLEEWTQQFEFGMSTQSGRRDKFDFNTLYDMRRRLERDDFRIQFRRFYGESNQEKTTDRTSSVFRWRHDISPGVFYQADTEYSADEIKEIDLNLEQTLGLGYRFIDKKNLRVSTGLGMSGRYREQREFGGERSYLVDLFQDVDYRMNGRLRLTQEFQLEVPPDKNDEYEYAFRMGVSSKVNDALHLSLRYQLEYDKSLPEDRREDQRVVSSVGVDF